jgi:hypothetical protein
VRSFLVTAATRPGAGSKIISRVILDPAFIVTAFRDPNSQQRESYPGDTLLDRLSSFPDSGAHLFNPLYINDATNTVAHFGQTTVALVGLPLTCTVWLQSRFGHLAASNLFMVPSFSIKVYT